MMPRACVVTALAALILASPATPAQVASTVAKLKETRSITIGYREAALPFSYVDAQGKPIGYAIDLCVRAVELMKPRLGLPELTIKWQPVTSANRFPLVTKGSVDLECGSTSNSPDRQKRVAFGPTYFVGRIAVLVSAQVAWNNLSQAGAQTVATAAGTTSAVAIKRYEETRRIELNDFVVRDHQHAFEALTTGRAAAVVLDEILLRAFVAASGTPEKFRFLDETLGVEGYGAVMRSGDPSFEELVTATFGEVMRSGEAERLYEKWFTKPIPPKGVTLGLPLSPELKALFQKPSNAPL